MTANPEFWERGYAIATDLLDPAQIAFTRTAMDLSRRAEPVQSTTRVTPQAALNEYSPVAGEVLLLQCQAEIEKVVGRKLIPAYAYWRIYEHGAELLRHIDRSSCEVSATLPIFSDPSDPCWPIFIGGLDGIATGVALMPGAAVIYQGCRVRHWREPFPGQFQYQVFLHYVIKDGPNAGFAFDGRESLSLHFRETAEG